MMMYEKWQEEFKTYSDDEEYALMIAEESFFDEMVVPREVEKYKPEPPSYEDDLEEEKRYAPRRMNRKAEKARDHRRTYVRSGFMLSSRWMKRHVHRNERRIVNLSLQETCDVPERFPLGVCLNVKQVRWYKAKPEDRWTRSQRPNPARQARKEREQNITPEQRAKMRREFAQAQKAKQKQKRLEEQKRLAEALLVLKENLPLSVRLKRREKEEEKKRQLQYWLRLSQLREKERKAASFRREAASMHLPPPVKSKPVGAMTVTAFEDVGSLIEFMKSRSRQ
jgi:hypothetical protein